MDKLYSDLEGKIRSALLCRGPKEPRDDWEVMVDLLLAMAKANMPLPKVHIENLFASTSGLFETALHSLHEDKVVCGCHDCPFGRRCPAQEDKKEYHCLVVMPSVLYQLATEGYVRLDQDRYNILLSALLIYSFHRSYQIYDDIDIPELDPSGERLEKEFDNLRDLANGLAERDADTGEQDRHWDPYGDFSDKVDKRVEPGCEFESLPAEMIRAAGQSIQIASEYGGWVAEEPIKSLIMSKIDAGVSFELVVNAQPATGTHAFFEWQKWNEIHKNEMGVEPIERSWHGLGAETYSKNMTLVVGDNGSEVLSFDRSQKDFKSHNRRFARNTSHVQKQASLFEKQKRSLKWYMRILNRDRNSWKEFVAFPLAFLGAWIADVYESNVLGALFKAAATICFLMIGISIVNRVRARLETSENSSARKG